MTSEQAAEIIVLLTKLLAAWQEIGTHMTKIASSATPALPPAPPPMKLG